MAKSPHGRLLPRQIAAQVMFYHRVLIPFEAETKGHIYNYQLLKHVRLNKTRVRALQLPSEFSFSVTRQTEKQLEIDSSHKKGVRTTSGAAQLQGNSEPLGYSIRHSIVSIW